MSPGETAPPHRHRLRSITAVLDSYRRGMSPPGILATRLARGAVVRLRHRCPRVKRDRGMRPNSPAGWCRLRRPPDPAADESSRPIALDRDPGQPPATRPRTVAGWGRAFGACCFAGKLRSPAPPLGRQPHPAQPGGGDPYASPYASPYARRWRTPSIPRSPASLQLSSLRGSGASARQGALRAVDSFRRSRSWRTCGPRRLRRQSKPALAATQGGTGGQRGTHHGLLPGGPVVGE
jgi:hypothetical protein